MNRPDSVPPDATWSREENEWQLGPYKGKGRTRTPIGEWKYWRPDGTLCCVANFDDQSRLHGVVTRFHPDGSIASSGEWKNGDRHGKFVFVRSEEESPEHYPANDETWRHEFRATNNWSEVDTQWFLKPGTPCTSDGRSLDSAFDLDLLISAASCETYLSDASPAVRAAFGESEETATDVFSLKEMWGVTQPELDEFAAYSIEGSSFSVVRRSRLFEDNNIWHSLLPHPWQNEFEELSAVFMGAVQIGSMGDSDGIYATLFHPPGGHAIYYWSHETYYIDEVMSLSLDEFAFRTAVSGAYEAERLSPEVTRAAWKQLAGRACVMPNSWQRP